MPNINFRRRLMGGLREHEGLGADFLTGSYYTRPAGGSITRFASFKDMCSTFTCPATWVRGADGIWVLTTANTVPIHYNADLTVSGMIAEFASRTNNALWSNDWTNAAWSKVNGAALKDVTGPDGVANSASRFTASFGANATCLQTFTDASKPRAYQLQLKRLVGSGQVSLTMDNGASWTPITITSEWLPYTLPGATLTNPSFGIKLDALNDSVAGTWNCLESNVTACGSPIETTTAAVVKNASTMTRTLGAEWGEPEGTIFTQSIRLGSTPTVQAIVRMDDDTNTNSIALLNSLTSPRFQTSRSGGVDLGAALDMVADGVVMKFAARYKNADYARVSNSGIVRTSSASGTVTPVLTRMRLGEAFFSGNDFFGVIQRVETWPAAMTDTQLQGLIT